MEINKIGFKNKKYSVRDLDFKDEYRMRTDSAVKLLEADNDWYVFRESDYNGMDGCVRKTDDTYTKLTEERLNKIKKKCKMYKYRADFKIEDDEITLEIWDVALGNWKLKNPNLVFN